MNVAVVTLYMSRKLEALSQQLVAMGFEQDWATEALIMNAGNEEISVSWRFDCGDRDYSGGGSLNLKIDISEQLAEIADLEAKLKCSKLEVERAIVARGGDLDKAAESLRVSKPEDPLFLQLISMLL